VGAREDFCFLGVLVVGSEEARLCFSKSGGSESTGVGGVTRVLGPSEEGGGVLAVLREVGFFGEGVASVGCLASE